jgi:hypothetical protein
MPGYNNVLVAGWVQIARRLRPQPRMTFSIKVILHHHKILLDHANSGRDGLTRAVAGKDSAFPRLALAVRLLFFRLLGARRERTRGVSMAGGDGRK